MNRFAETLSSISLGADDVADIRVELRDRVFGNSSADACIVVQPGDLLMADVGSLGRDHYYRVIHAVFGGSNQESPSETIEPAVSPDRTTRIAQAVIHAIDSDHTLGALALDTQLVEVADMPDEQNPMTRVTFRVHFWTLKSNPYQQ